MRSKAKPFMDHLQVWMEAQLEQKRVEPNSDMGIAINYMRKRWDKLTLLLRTLGNSLFSQRTRSSGRRHLHDHHQHRQA
jgi:hypothetical protein